MFNRLLPKNTLQLVLQRTYRVNNLILSPRRLFSAAEDLMLEKKAYAVNMPEIMEAKVFFFDDENNFQLYVFLQDGKVTKWLKDEGDEFHIGEAICEISTAGLTIAFEAERAGVLLQRLVYEGQVIEVNTPIAHAAIDKQAYMDYIDHKRVEAMEDAMQAEIKEEVEKKQEKSKKPDNLVLMREIKHLIQDGHIEDGSGKTTYQLVMQSV